MCNKEVIEMAIEMVSVTEAFGKGTKALLSADAKESTAHLKEAKKLKKSGNKSGAKKEYQKAIDCMNKVKKNVEKIEDENIGDWLITLFLKPWWYLLFQAIEADFDFKGLTRQSTLKQIDKSINQAKKEMNAL